jgi:hypothetical protein
MVSAVVLRRKMFFPESISYRVRPNEKISDSRVYVSASYLFGRHIGNSSKNDSWHGLHSQSGRTAFPWECLRSRKFGQTKIEYLGAAVLRQKYVFGLEIAVDNSSFMCGCKSISNLYSPLRALSHWNRSRAEPFAQTSPFEQLGYDKRRTFVFTDQVNCQDARMTEGGGGLCFLLKTPKAVTVVESFCMEDFYGPPRGRGRCRGRDILPPCRLLPARREFRTSLALYLEPVP